MNNGICPHCNATLQHTPRLCLVYGSRRTSVSCPNGCNINKN